MKVCQNCNSQLDDDVKFCSGCGAKQEKQSELVCSGCGTPLAVGARFCPECGTQQTKETEKKCTGCGVQLPLDAGFCPECGHKQASVLSVTRSVSLSSGKNIFVKPDIPAKKLSEAIRACSYNINPNDVVAFFCDFFLGVKDCMIVTSDRIYSKHSDNVRVVYLNTVKEILLVKRTLSFDVRINEADFWNFTQVDAGDAKRFFDTFAEYTGVKFIVRIL